MLRKALKICPVALAAVVAYAAAGIAVSSFLFPPQPVDHANYFQPGDKLFSKFEGFDQTVVSIDGDQLRTRLEVLPHAGGPPEHFHEGFEETFTVKSGTLSLLVNGEKRTLTAGQTLTVPRMTPHKPFNETDEVVVVESPDQNSIPVRFGYALSQLYGFMDKYPEGPPTFAIMMQLAAMGNDVDTWIADGPPLGVQKAMRVVMEPTARLLGYKYYEPNFSPASKRAAPAV